MCDNARSRLQFRLPHLAALALGPKRTHGSACFFLQSAGKIDDRAARITGTFPVLARTLRGGGKEGEIHVGKLLGAHALDEIDLVARRFQLAYRLIIVEQPDVHSGTMSLAEHFGDFRALERGRTHDGSAVKPPAPR